MNRRGVGLLEAIVALAILSLAGVAAIAGAAAQTTAAHRARLHLQASVLADYRMEQLRLLMPQELARIQQDPGHGRFSAPHGAFTWEVGAASFAGSEDVRELHVIIRHPDVEVRLTSRVYIPAAGES